MASDQPKQGRRARTDADRAALRQVGENVRRIREERGITVEAFADLLDVHQTHVYKIQRGANSAGIVLLRRISIALECTVADLVEGVE